jgi:hypothetical protein
MAITGLPCHDGKEKAERRWPLRFRSCQFITGQGITLPGSTLTPGPMVEDTATRWT